MLKDRNIVFMAPHDFDDIRGRVHHLAERFARSNNVLFVETQESLPFLIRKGRWRKLFRGLFSPLRKMGNLWTLTPLACLPFDGVSELANRINSALLKWQLLRTFRKLDISRPIVVFYMPGYYRLVGRLGESASVYDLVDERSALPGRHGRCFAAREQAMLSRCDLTVVVSERLLNAKRDRARQIALIPNGADTALFSNARKTATELDKLTRPIIGYVGAIDEWFDFELLWYLARNRPNWNFVLVGPVRTRFRKPEDLGNVLFLGERRYDELPNYTAGFDCCIVPHKLTTFRLFSDPLKVYEYIAAGKPVVSVPIPSVERFGELVSIARDRRSFLTAIERELESDSPAKAERRKEAAREFDWSARAEAMSAEMEKILNDNQS